MTKVIIEPGICNFTAVVTADSEDGQEVTIQVTSGCKAVSGMMEALGESFDAFELCMNRPGQGPLFDYAGEHFPAHTGCPVIAGITKCVEAECGLALKHDASIRFVE